MTDIKLKILRKMINWAVEKYFPDGAFFGNDYFEAFKDHQMDGEALGQASTLWITHNMNIMNAQELKVKKMSVSIKGIPIGDFEMIATLTPNDKSELYKYEVKS